ncbi:MAG TPA: beta-propeller fold lactonase family protein [Terriglobales bacterium]|nr:beta-propeller fold lactonase family protein [Terriglobales bacterium]
MKRYVALLTCLLSVCALAQDRNTINLPTSKVLLTPVPGEPQRAGSFPVTVALSPDGRYLAILDDGFGLAEHEHRQGIGVLDLETNALKFYPDERLGQKNHQTYFIGLAFSADGARLYASVASLTDPLAKLEGSTGNGVAVYRFEDGAVTPEAFLSIPVSKLLAGKRRASALNQAPAGTAIPYPAGLAVVRGRDGEQVLVANNLADDALLLEVHTGKIVHRFDLSISDHVPAAYPYQVVANREGTRAWCSLWNASRIAELDLTSGKVVRWIAVRPGRTATKAGSHPTAMLLSPKQNLLFVSLSNRDEIAVISTRTGRVVRYLSTILPNEKFAGTFPNALAQTPDGRRLFVANASSNAVAVFDSGREPGQHRIRGFIPTEWYPTALAVRNNDLLIATGKSQGTGPNSAVVPRSSSARSGHPYIVSLLHGSIARVDLAQADKNLVRLTREVAESNRMNGRSDEVAFSEAVCPATIKRGRAGNRCNPIKHVIYIIKENRTYDQLFGDLEAGNGDASLVMYGEQITPNHHKLARQFGILDNFYDSGDVSGNGHVWSTAAITSDYTEKTWQIGYRGRERSYDYEGQVANETPLEQGIPDVNEPSTGYLWTNAARHGVTYRHYGEYVATSWCDDPTNGNPQETGTPASGGAHCQRKFVNKGEPLPPNVGDPKGGPSPWPWPVPMIAGNIATKPELRDHFDPNYADFRMEYPDQLRADEFLNEFSQFVRDRKAGKDTLPRLIVLRLPNDHTIGTRPNRATPAATLADNDLALGRVVEAVSKSPYWDDTAVFVLEDDAQDGADHVDAHRSIALVISKYAPRAEKPIVHSEFYTTVNVIHTMEALLGLPPMNNNDAQAPLMTPLFGGNGDQPAFTADYRNRDNGLLYQVNPPDAAGGEASMKMDFTHADSVDTQALNRILWREAKGNVPMPEPKHTVIPVGR